MPHLVLIVDDEKDFARSIEYNLGKEGYQTRCAYDGKTALEMARLSPHPDIVLLDLMLPDISGTDVCRELKSDSATKHIPVIMVTAKGNEIDRVVGFELGADDYVVKPFSVRELMLRIKAVLRRAPVADSEEQHIVFGKLKIDVPAHKVWVNNEEQELTALEFRLLETLYNRRGRVQTRNTLLSDVWGIDSDVTTRTVDTHIKRLREKLGECGKFIETIRGVGYRFIQEAGDDA
jgi:two-component system, OmpR family, phosphate regulon response regulator PhoB